MDWGFRTFCPIERLQDPGLLRPTGELRIRVEMTVSLNEHVVHLLSAALAHLLSQPQAVA